MAVAADFHRNFLICEADTPQGEKISHYTAFIPLCTSIISFFPDFVNSADKIRIYRIVWRDLYQKF